MTKYRIDSNRGTFYVTAKDITEAINKFIEVTKGGRIYVIQVMD
jgi:hypothetical protein